VFRCQNDARVFVPSIHSGVRRNCAVIRLSSVCDHCRSLIFSCVSMMFQIRHRSIRVTQNLIFNVHMSVHRKYISKVQPTKCNVFSIYLFLHVSGGFCAHHQDHKTVHTASGIVKPILLPTAIVDEMERSSISSTIAAGSSIGLTIPDAVCTVL